MTVDRSADQPGRDPGVADVLAAALHGSRDGMVVLDEDDVVLEWNVAATTMFGYERSVALGSVLGELIMSDGVRADHAARLQRYCSTGDAAGLEQATAIPARRADGSTNWVEFTLTPSQRGTGRALFAGLFREIEGSSDGRQVKSESNSRLAALLANVSDIITVLGPGGEWISSSGAGRKVLGWQPNLDPQGGIFALLHPDDVEPAIRAFNEVVDGTRTIFDPIDLRVTDVDGRYHVLETVGENLIDDERVRGVVLTSRDATAARAAQRALEERTAQVTALVSSLADGVLFVDARHDVVMVNQPFLDMFTIDGTPDSLLGRSAAELAARSGAPYADEADAVATILQRYEDTEPTVDELVIMLDGRVFERDSIPVTFGEGRRVHLWVVRDVTEREEITRHRVDMLQDTIEARDQTEQQNRALLELTEMRSQFVATISHELRTPLASIVSFSELLRGDLEAAGWTEQREFVDAIDRNAQRLLRLVNDLLLLRRIEAGAMSIDRDSGTMDALVKGAVKALEPMAAARHQQLEMHVEPGPALFADLGRLDQVLVNLLSNAVKFTPEGGVISVTASVVPGDDVTERRWKVVVSDNGVGIPAHEQAHLFERFYRGAQSASGVSGTGLGLAISRAVVELHGGRIRIESEEGVGTSTIFELPTEPTAERPTESAVRVPTDSRTIVGGLDRE